jgi:oxygen-independent coproporphyrinogen-3 oxidase
MEEAEKNGFLQYEISNFCKPNFMAVHNSNYWRDSWYLGVGPSAHSYNGISRRYNVKSNVQYVQLLETERNYFEEEILSKTDRYNEYVLTRLRTNWGCDLDEVKRIFGDDYSGYFTRKIKRYKNSIIQSGNIITLNRLGKHFADGIAADLFYEQ